MLIAELITIWEATFAVPYPVLFTDYRKIKDIVFYHVFTELKKQFNLQSD